MFATIRKIFLVCIITVLIWVWADQALTRDLPNVPSVLHVDKSTDPQLWVSFDKQTTAPLRIKLSGPAAKISDVEKKLREKGSAGLDFYYNPGQVNMTEPVKKFSLPLLELVQKSRIIQDSGLQVQSVSPETVDVEIVKLITQKLTIQVLSDTQVPMPDAIVEPATIEMAVRQDYSGTALKATIALTKQEVDQARVSPVQRIPVVELSPGVLKFASSMVKVSLPPTENRLKEYTINETNIEICFSPNLQGTCKAELINKNQLLEAIKVRATPDAKAAFETTVIKMRLEVFDDDIKSTGEITRPVIFNFPEEYIRKGELVSNEPEQRIARFKIVQSQPMAEKAAAAAAELK